MFKKIVNSVKKDVGRSSFKSVALGKGHLGRIFNPISAYYYQLPKKAYSGIKRKSWTSNLLKYQGGGSRSASSAGSVVAGARTARSIAFLTTH